MFTLGDAQYLADSVKDLGVLYESFAHGRELANAHFDEHGMRGPAYNKGRTDLTREHARKHLSGRDIGPWKLLTGGGCIHLHNDMLKLKVLHAHPIGATPPPGRNKARMSFYRNADLNLFGAAASSLVAVWMVDAQGEIIIRIVRPVGTWKAGASEKTDIDFVLPRTVEDFANLEFVPDDGALELDFEFDENDLGEEGETGGA